MAAAVLDTNITRTMAVIHCRDRECRRPRFLSRIENRDKRDEMGAYQRRHIA
jgi:hypothetical protein